MGRETLSQPIDPTVLDLAALLGPVSDARRTLPKDFRQILRHDHNEFDIIA